MKGSLMKILKLYYVMDVNRKSTNSGKKQNKNEHGLIVNAIKNFFLKLMI